MKIAVILFAALLSPLLSAEQPSTQLQATLDKLDQASARFTSAQADFHKVFYNHFLKSDDDQQSGRIYFTREHNATQMGLLTTGPQGRTVEFKSGTLRVFNPGPGCFDTVIKPGIETYLTLGFGGSGKDLAKAWNITDLGPETLDNTKVEKLELVAKDPAVLANIKKFTLWIDLARGITLKQVLLNPSNDLQTATYTHIRLNEKVDTKPFTFKGKPCGQ